MDDNREEMRIEEQQPPDGELDALLKRRASERSELPWLALSVSSEIEARERARQWLAQHGSLFGPNGKDRPGSRPLRTCRHWIAQLQATLTPGLQQRFTLLPVVDDLCVAVTALPADPFEHQVVVSRSCRPPWPARGSGRPSVPRSAGA